MTKKYLYNSLGHLGQMYDEAHEEVEMDGVWFARWEDCERLERENARLREVLLNLYNGTAEYVTLNNLGDPHNTTPMRNAAAVLGVSYPRSLRADGANRPAAEPGAAQAPIARMMVADGHVTWAFLNAPGLPNGIHHVYCEPQSGESGIEVCQRCQQTMPGGVALHTDYCTALKTTDSSELAATVRAGNAALTCDGACRYDNYGRLDRDPRCSTHGRNREMVVTELGKDAKRMGHEHPRVTRRTDPVPERATPAAKPHRKARLPFGFSYEEYWWWAKFCGKEPRWERHWKWFKTAASRDQAMKHHVRTSNPKYFRDARAEQRT